MRIVIDLQGAQSNSRHRGIGRYSLSLAQSMAKLGEGHEIIIALNGLLDETIEPIRSRFDGLVSQNNIRVWQAAGPVSALNPGNLWRRHAAELAREAFLQNLHPDVVYITSLVEGFDDDSVHSIGKLQNTYCTAATFYDVIPLLQSEIYLTPHVQFEPAYREKISYLQKADLFFAISESSRREAIDHLGANPDTVTSIAAAMDANFHPLPANPSVEAAVRHRLNIGKRFILYSGASDERKNHLRLIKAFSMLPFELRERFQLAIVGRLPPSHLEKFKAQVAACGLTDQNVVITGGVTDRELLLLYNMCDLFVFPSWHEGFGLPALEAMACGAAVIASNTTSLPEVIGRKDALFDPFDEKSIADKMSLALRDEAFRLDLKRHGLVQAKNFSWEKSASLVLSRLEQWFASRSRDQSSHTRSTHSHQTLEALIGGISALSPPSTSIHDWTLTAHAIAQNHPRQQGRQLFIDVSELAQRDSRGGIQRVVRAVLTNLLASPPDGLRVTLVRSTPGVIGYRRAINFSLSFLGLPTHDQEEPPIEPRNGDIFLLGLDLDWNAIIHEGYLKSLREIGVSIFFVIYDLIPVTMPGAYPSDWNMYGMQSLWLDVVQQHDGVICISRAVAQEFKGWINSFGTARLRPLKVGFFHLGSDVSGSVPSHGLSSDADFVLSQLRNRFSYLSVGTLEPRKGQVQTLQAFDLLWAAGVDVNLVVVGKRGWDGPNWSLTDAVKMFESHPERGRRFFWLESISDEYLENIYKRCNCLLVTSMAEGFGIPIIEAAAYGLPIIARDLPVFREVAGENAHYFQGIEPTALATQIMVWKSLSDAGRAPSSGGIASLTWRQSTQMLLDVFLRNNWYYEWLSGKGQRFRASDSRFGTVVGKRDGREMLSTGRSGFLLHGPYISPESGKYKITVNGHITRLSAAYVDVVMDMGKLVLGKADLNPADSPLSGNLVSIAVSIPEISSKLEVRLWIDSLTEVAISHVDVLPIESI